jgi:hypothetical protein
MRLVVAGLIVFLCLAGTAQASRLTRLGDHVWGPAACGEPRTAYGDPAEWGVPNAAGWSDPEQCTIYLDVWYVTQPRPFQCQLWLHERGHVAGYHHPVGVRQPDGTYDHTHSPDPRSIMYPESRLMAGWEGRKKRRYVYHVDRRCRPRTFARLTSR